MGRLRPPRMLLSVLVLLSASLAAAQQVPQPVFRQGNWLAVGNEVFLHLIGTADIRYKTGQDFDFERAIRDRPPSREPNSTAVHESLFDGSYAELRFGADFRYQERLQAQILFEHEQVFDGALVDDRSNTLNPGGTDIFGRPAGAEDPGFHVERYWIDYRFAGTPFRVRFGADLWTTDQAGLVGDDDPRFAVFAKWGAFDVSAAVVFQGTAQRLGLLNDNDFLFYTFGAGYSFAPHRLQIDISYFRERFNGADTQQGGAQGGFRGQKSDSVLIMPSWSGMLGPVRGLLQGNLLVGTSRGGTGFGLPPGVPAGRQYDILAFGVVAYVEAQLGIVRPFAGLVYGTGDGDPTDRQLHGFMTLPQRDITLISATPFFAHLETSTAFHARDYSCPAGANGMTRTLAQLTNNPFAVGTLVLGGNAATGFAECAHTTGNPFNDRLGNISHLGLASAYSNPGTFNIPLGVRLFPWKGHEITGWYVYRAMAKTGLLEAAFAPELRGRNIARSQYHEIGGFWQWTLNPHFDIRLAGNVALPGEGYQDLARLANCNSGATGGQASFQSCRGQDAALAAEARFRARF
ncbi:MAG: hypothetical protein AB7N91_25265 [Candidatus Tectimicrobiota bacterium]